MESQAPEALDTWNVEGDALSEKIQVRLGRLAALESVDLGI